MKDTENKYRNWCFTLMLEESVISYAKLEEFMRETTEAYVFQGELGEETKKHHHQGCFRTKIRVRQSTLLNKFTKHFGEHLLNSYTLNRMCGDWDENVAYCTKQETRVSKDVYCSPHLKKYVGRDIEFLAERDNRYPWQESILRKIFKDEQNTIKVADDRKIYWITDICGNSGKSKFTKYLAFNNPGIIKVSFGTATQLRSSLITAGPREVYIIDIPRTLGQDDSIDSLLSCLEDLKNGYVVSSMYGKHL